MSASLCGHQSFMSCSYASGGLPRQIVYELTKIGYKNLQNWLDRYYLRDIAYRGEKINRQTGKYEKQNYWLKKPYKRFYFQR